MRESRTCGYGRKIEEDCDLGFVGEKETNTSVGLAVSFKKELKKKNVCCYWTTLFLKKN
jgi:hypothetical protein